MVDLQVHRFPRHLAAHHRPIQRLEDGSFEDGFGFDGSSIRGWQPINASDMLDRPRRADRVMDPFIKHPTLSLICNIVDPITQRAVRARPAQHREEGRGVPEADRHRRHGLLRPRGGVLHLRRRALRLEPPRARSTRSTRPRRLEPGRDEGPNLGYKSATRAATSRSCRPTRSSTSAPR